jgi:hypothetical protein
MKKIIDNTNERRDRWRCRRDVFDDQTFKEYNLNIKKEYG